MLARNWQTIGEQLAKLPDWQTIDWVIPVPLHPAKELKRGYNQSDTLPKV